MTLQSRIEAAITTATNQMAELASSENQYGGCINQSQIITLKDQKQYFVKTHPQAESYPGLFETEFKALTLLSAPNVIHVPKPIACDKDFIIMEVFIQGAAAKDWQEKMGRQLAELHRATKNKQFGFDRDNYLGTSKQINTWQDSWLDFWREQRLGYQLELFANTAQASDSLLQAGEKLMNSLDDILGNINEPAVLLHGDLWSGNASANEKGDPVIFDPASYYGHREAEIGMMRMFGGFGPRCEAAYNEVWPFEADKERRINLYRLYHELNHLNLFGSGYYQSCLSTIRSLI